MQEPPNIDLNQLAECLKANWGIHTTSLEYLNLGMDSWNYQINSQYFVKLKRHQTRVSYERLRSLQLDHLGFVLPIQDNNGNYHQSLSGFEATVFPLINGQTLMSLPDDKKSIWQYQLGRSISKLHGVNTEDIQDIPLESFDRYRAQAQQLLAMARPGSSHLQEVHELIQENRGKFTNVIEASTSRLGDKNFVGVLCHGDIHEANVLIGDNSLFIVDLDSLIIAPPERDLFFFVTGISATGSHHYLRGYCEHTPIEINQELINYYLCEWALQELVDYWQLIASDVSEQQKLLYLEAFREMFMPGGDFERAFHLFD